MEIAAALQAAEATPSCGKAKGDDESETSTCADDDGWYTRRSSFSGSDGWETLSPRSTLESLA
jgi:hypothetical protein